MSGDAPPLQRREGSGRPRTRAAVFSRQQRADAAAMRREPTEAAAKPWRHRRGRRPNGAKFSRRIAIGPYLADFACRERRLAIASDGLTAAVTDA